MFQANILKHIAISTWIYLKSKPNSKIRKLSTNWYLKIQFIIATIMWLTRGTIHRDFWCFFLLLFENSVRIVIDEKEVKRKKRRQKYLHIRNQWLRCQLGRFWRRFEESKKSFSIDQLNFCVPLHPSSNLMISIVETTFLCVEFPLAAVLYLWAQLLIEITPGI